MPPEFIAIPIFGMITGVTAIGIVTWGIVSWRKAQAGPPSRSLATIEARLERIEHAMDAVAVEVERISEGQRFTTQLLTERARETPRVTSGPGG